MVFYPALCAPCFDIVGAPRPAYSDPLGTTGQRASHVKHSQISTRFDRQSTFDSNSTAYWRNTQNETLAKGAYEVTYQGPRFVYVPSIGSRIGAVNSRGSELYPADTVVAVNPWVSTGAHILADGSSRWSRARCGRCGGPLLRAST